MANGLISQFLTVEARFSKVFLTEDSVCPSEVKHYLGNKTESSQLLANFLQVSVQS